MNFQSYHFEITTLNALSHIGKTASTGTVFNTERVNGVDIPFVTGNGMKGILRRLGTELWLDKLGINQDNQSFLTQNRLEVLFNGSILSKADKAANIKDYAMLEKLIPWFTVCGGCIGNMMIQSRLVVHPLILICQENQDRLKLIQNTINLGIDNDDRINVLCNKELKSFRHYLTRQEFTHLSDFNRLGSEAHKYLPLLEQKRHLDNQIMLLDLKAGDDYQDTESHIQMRYNNQMITPMTPFYWRVDTSDLTPIMEGAFYATMQYFMSRPYICGQKRIGHGYVNIKPIGKTSIKPISTELAPFDFQNKTKLYFDYLEKNKSDIIECLKIIPEK